MATLVLTTVGGAIGGPIGAALGATLGRRVDGELLFRQKRREGPRLTDLAVQTSRYGTQIPKLFGTNRVAGCVIWSTDLQEHRATSGGGKGQPGTATYSYSASFAVALSARPIVEVRRIWADGTLLRGAAGDWKARTGFRLYQGHEDQAADPLIAGATGSALAYRGIAYVVFENMALADYGNRLPSLTFEVVAEAAPVRIGDVAAELGAGTILTGGPDEAVTGFAASGDSVRTVVGMLGELSGGWFVPAAGGAMRFANRVAGARALTADPAAMRRQPQGNVPATLALSHYDPARDYQIGVQRARRPGAGWREEAVDAPVVLPAEGAMAVAGAMLRRRDRARTTRQVTSDVTAMAIAPGDAVTLPDEAEAWRVTRAECEGMRVTLHLSPPPEPMPVRRPADAGQPLTSPDVAAGRTLLRAAELPALDDTTTAMPRIAVLAAGSGPGWRRAGLLMSRDDGASWSEAGATVAPAVMGRSSAAIDARPATLADRISVLEIELAHGAMTLTGADDAAMHRGANLALLGGELVQFGEAVQAGARQWRVTRLWRGRRGTGPARHLAGTSFTLVGADALSWLDLPGGRPGERIRLIASGAGDGDEPAVCEVVLTGASVAPPAPVRLRAVRAAGTIRATWVRRSRLGWAWNDGVDVPLAEEGERYRATLVCAGVARTIIVDGPAVGWTDDVPDAPVTIEVAQIGTFAPSPPATIILGVEP